MTLRTALLAATLLAFSVPAMAATNFYVAKNEATKKCEVTSAKPDGKSMMDVGKKVWATKTEAETAMKGIADCK